MSGSFQECVLKLLTRLITAFSLNALLCPGVLAQQRFDHWPENGLPQSSVSSIIQPRDGYLWVATFNGLARFDGVRFTVFDRNNSPGMIANDCTVLYEDSAGTLWIGTGESNSGLMRYQNGLFTSFTTAQGLTSGSVRRIQSGRQASDGLRRRGAASLRNGRFEPEPGSDSEFRTYLGRSGTRWSLDKERLATRAREIN